MEKTKELYCSECGSIKEWPICCCREMECDSKGFFCNFCSRELKLIFCCGKQMTERKIKAKDPFAI